MAPVTIKLFKRSDLRGCHMELYHSERYHHLGISEKFVQDNYSYSKHGVLRGMHFQYGQAKMVTCLYGTIYDMIVDVRKESPTFGKSWCFYIKDGDMQIFLPNGFAHGFCVLSEEALVVYKVTSLYDRSKEMKFHYSSFEWPISKPILSKEDRDALLLEDLL